jgi:hypothetical protein
MKVPIRFRRMARAAVKFFDSPKRAVIIFTLALMFTATANFLLVKNKPALSMLSDTESISIGFAMVGDERAPRISAIEPDQVFCGGYSIPIFIRGENFIEPVAVELIEGNKPTQAYRSYIIDSSTIFALFDLREAEAELYDMRVNTKNGKSIIKDALLLNKWLRAVPITPEYLTTWGDDISLEKRVDAQNHDMVSLRISGALPEAISKAYLVTTGSLIQSSTIDNYDGTVSIYFNMNGEPLAEYDLVLTNGVISLVSEKAINSQDRSPSFSIISVDPSSCASGEVVDLQVHCEDLPEEVEPTLIKGDIEIEPTVVNRVSKRKVVCNFNLDGAEPGKYNVLVKEQSGGTAVVLSDCFMVLEEEGPGTQPDQGGPQLPIAPQDPQPIAEEGEDPEVPPGVSIPENFVVTPSFGCSGETIDLVVEGGPFQKGFKARLSGPMATAWSLKSIWYTQSKMGCRFNLDGLPAGVYRLDILDYAGDLVYIAGSFEVI